jgi:hypothetical protein
MFNDYDYDYQAYNKDGKEQLIKLDFEQQKLYGWQSTRAHLAEGGGGSAPFENVLQEDNYWHNWIKEIFGKEVLAEVLQKIEKALKTD